MCDYRDARAERRSSRSKGLGKEAAGPRRSRRGKPAELGRRCVTKEQGARESERPWQGRERQVLHVLALDGDGRLERALVRLRLADGSRFTAWVAAVTFGGANGATHGRDGLYGFTRGGQPRTAATVSGSSSPESWAGDGWQR